VRALTTLLYHTKTSDLRAFMGATLVLLNDGIAGMHSARAPGR